MSNYTKEDLESKVKKDLVIIASNLNLDTKGNRTDLINRIHEHKPSFKEMIDDAPVSKDGDLNISVEDISDAEVTDTPTEGETKNDTIPDEPSGGEIETEVETKVETETETEVEKETPIPDGMVPENTAEDILKGWQHTVQGFYRKNTPGVAPARPASPTAIAGQLGIPEASGILARWQASIISRLRPVRGVAPAPPKTAKDMIQIIKSL